MPIEIKGIVCPHCGGTDVEMLTDGHGLCRMCGSQFAVHRYDPAASEKAAESEVYTYRIQPEYSKEDFLRRVWIELCKEDAPAELFADSMSEIETVEYHVVMQLADVEGNYSVSIGYERREPYLDTETYWERVGDRNVKKERIVTKYRTATDWQAHSGTTGMRSIDCVDNDLTDGFDSATFKNCYLSIKDSSTKQVLPSEAVAVRTEAYEILRGYHELNLKYHLLHELPGDYNKDLSLHLTKQDVLSTTVYIVTEYRISIRCAGKKYVRNAFPFGNMEIGGDKIPNENSMWRNVGKEREAVPHEIWKRTRLISFLTMALLALSIIVNLFIHSTVLTIVCFAAGVGAFIWNTINVRNKTSDVERETDETIAQYQTKYRTWRLGLLNNKLTSLGLAPITDMEGGAKV